MIVDTFDNHTLRLHTPAKVNLFLEVLAKRPDGFHDINSAFQAVSLYDFMEFNLTSEPGIMISVLNNTDLTVGDDNLVARAYHLMKERFELAGGFSVALEKNIPIAAGLAGGSSDAAATILAINILYNLGLDYAEMAAISQDIGSDLPFFFSGGQAIVTGRGEKVKEAALPTDYWLVLVSPNFPISTADSYAALKRDLTYSKNPFNLPRCQTVEELLDALNGAGNDFEEVHFRSFSQLERIRDELFKCGALRARMSGSGPTMFGIFGAAPKLEQRDLQNRGDWQLYTVQPIALPKQMQF